MNILGIGPLEIIVLLLIALLIFGPDDLNKAGKTAGKFIWKVRSSETWKSFKEITKELKRIPNKLAREAQFDEIQETMNNEEKTILPPKRELGIEEDTILDAWATPQPKNNDKPLEDKNQLKKSK